MRSSKTTGYAGSAGVGFCEVLGIVFIVLKLVGVIDWSWWLVLLPIYAPLAIFLLGAVIVFIFATIKYFIKRGKKE